MTDYSNEIDDIITALETKFQNKLISATNIKTINHNSVLGSGNITIQGGGTLDPELVYTCSSFNSTYINTSATNRLMLYKLGCIYFIRYFITTNTLTSASTDYLINNDSISSEYRPSSNITFHIPTSSNHNAKLTINTSGQVRISADDDSVAISFAGSQTYWWAGTGCDGTGTGGFIGVGSFNIENNGHLIVTLPDGVSNPYSINASGHLIYDTNAGGS